MNYFRDKRFYNRSPNHLEVSPFAFFQNLSLPLSCDISRQLVPPLTLFQGWKSSCAPYRFPEGPGSQSVPMLPTCECGTLEILLVQPRI